MGFLHNQIELTIGQFLDRCEVALGGCKPEAVIGLELGSFGDEQCPCIHRVCQLKYYFTIGNQCEDLGGLLN